MRKMAIVSKQAPGMTTDALVSEDAALSRLVESWPAEAALALDTEFVRERTYYPKLCLVQVAAGDSLALIDPLAIADARTLAAALADPRRPKLLHAARQDIEALLPLTVIPLAPVFDTQIAAALLGFASQIGYADLVHQLLGVELAKGHARTDWARRPLSPEQLAYAADDVRYLPALAALLDERLITSGRRRWMEEESAALTEISLYRVEPAEAWRRLKGLERMKPAAQAALCAPRPLARGACDGSRPAARLGPARCGAPRDRAGPSAHARGIDAARERSARDRGPRRRAKSCRYSLAHPKRRSNRSLTMERARHPSSCEC